MSHSRPVVRVDQMRALEATAFAAGISERQLQANAAAEIALVVGRERGSRARLVVLVGSGNNGRDAFLAGRQLARRGWQTFNYLAPRHAITDSELDTLASPQERYLVHAGDQALEVLQRELAAGDIALDGLLGIGVRGPMRAPLDSMARLLNEAGQADKLSIASVDVPSGIDADSGDVPGLAVRASLTVALGAVKAGCLRFPAATYVGRLEVRPIGLPDGADANCRTHLLTLDGVAPLVPERPLDAHKGSLGWVLVVGGSHEYIGAPILSASAAARSGCGLVALAVSPSAQTAAAASLPEATFALREAGQAPALQAERLLSRIHDFRAVVVGPGLGRDSEALALARALLSGLRAIDKPPAVVIDADALYALSNWPEWWTEIPPNCVLTPHFGEMARLVGLSTSDIGRQTWEIASKMADSWQQVVVLKGPHTVVAAPSAESLVYPRANPALATAGTGDVLAGLIGGLSAQGLEPSGAARLAVVVHAQAAERVLERNGWRSLVASDLLPGVPAVLADLAAATGFGGT